MLTGYKKIQLAIYIRLSPPRHSRFCRCCRCCCCHRARAAILPRDLPLCGCFSSRCSTAAVSTRYQHACFFCHYTPRSRGQAATMPRDVAPPNSPSGRVHMSGSRAAYREICRHVSPRFRLPPHLLSFRHPAAAAVDGVATAVMEQECTRPRRAT